MAPTSSAPETAGRQYARYGDYLSAQMQSNRSFGYGMFICTMQPANGPVCSTFWLYSNEPSPAQSPDVAQNWRWNEVDFEFVPQTQATQAAYATFDGGLPNPSLQIYGATVDLGDPRSQVLDPATLTWTSSFERTDEVIAKQMWDYYNTWMTAQTGGAATGGTFTLEDGGTGSTTTALAYNASTAAVQTALDLLNGGKGLFNLKGSYTVAVSAAGGVGSIKAGALGTIVLSTTGLIEQLAVGDAVTVPADTTLLPTGTTIAALDVAANTIALSASASAASPDTTFQFTPIGAFSINFTTPQSGLSPLIIDTSALTPAGSLGKVVAGLTSGGDVQALAVSVFQPYYAPANGSTWWDLLAQQTGPGLAWPNATTWKYPLTTMQTPASLDLSKAVALNFWRSPKGNTSATVDFGSWGTVKHTGVLSATPIAGTTVASSFTSAVLNNEAYLFDTSATPFDPYTGFNTYTIVWTPTRMAQYVNAPNGGRDVGHATPVAEFDLAGYPSIDHSGPQAPGGHIPWISSEIDMPVGNVTMNLANYVAFRAASTGPNPPVSTTGTLTTGSASITNVADLSGISAGLVVSGPGVPVGSTVVSIDVSHTSTSVVMSAQATASATAAALTFTPQAVVTTNGTLTTNSAAITSVADVTAVLIGQSVSGTGVPAGTTVTNVDVASSTVTMSAAATASTTAASLTFSALLNGATTGDVEIGSPSISNIANPAVVFVGQSVSGAGVPAGASVTNMDPVGGIVTLNLPATETASAVALTFTTTPSGLGWSGPPPSATFDGVDALVRTIGWYPLIAGTSGKHASDFDLTSGDAMWLDFADDAWSGGAFDALFPQHFGILYSQDFTSVGAIPGTSPLVDAKSPLAVSWVAAADGKGAMQLSCTPSQMTPKRNFFVVFATQASAGVLSATNPLVRVVVRGPSLVTISAAATQNDRSAALTFSSATTGTLTSGSSTVTAVADVSLIMVGQSVTGAGIPAGTTVSGLDASASTVTLSAAATQSGAAVALTFSNTTTGNIRIGSAAVNVPAGAVPVRVGQAVSGAGVPAGATVVAVTDSSYAASSSVGPPTAFYAPSKPLIGTSSGRLLVEVWCSPTSYYGEGETPAVPDHTASIIVSTDHHGNISWSIDHDPDGVMVPYDSANPFRIAVAAPA